VPAPPLLRGASSLQNCPRYEPDQQRAADNHAKRNPDFFWDHRNEHDDANYDTGNNLNHCVV
jgi:hypothetical protein